MTHSTELDISTGVFMGLIISAFVIWLSHKQTNDREDEKHIWRPALTSRGPARTCICGATEDITTEEFYAQFGTMPNVGIIGR